MIPEKYDPEKRAIPVFSVFPQVMFSKISQRPDLACLQWSNIKI